MKILTAVLMTAMLAGYAGAADKKAPEKDAWKKRVFTAEELKKYNGREWQPAYAAVDGIVYDLSKSKYWKTGTHMKQHEAGADLSADIHEKAPKSIHRDGKILSKMPKVGVTEEYAKKKPEASAAKGKTAGEKEKKMKK